jgi:hypothetical protein
VNVHGSLIQRLRHEGAIVREADGGAWKVIHPVTFHSVVIDDLCDYNTLYILRKIGFLKGKKKRNKNG